MEPYCTLEATEGLLKDLRSASKPKVATIVLK
jgi:hypothetical protein